MKVVFIISQLMTYDNFIIITRYWKEKKKEMDFNPFFATQYETYQEAESEIREISIKYDFLQINKFYVSK